MSTCIGIEMEIAIPRKPNLPTYLHSLETQSLKYIPKWRKVTDYSRWILTTEISSDTPTSKQHKNDSVF